MDNLFETISNISKGAAYDVLREQVTELGKLCHKLIEASTEGRQFIVDNMDALPDSQNIRLKMLVAIHDLETSKYLPLKTK